VNFRAPFTTAKTYHWPGEYWPHWWQREFPTVSIYVSGLQWLNFNCWEPNYNDVELSALPRLP